MRFPVLAAVTVAGCMPPLVENSPTQVYLPPDDVVRVAEGVFQRHSIPVEASRPSAGRLESGEFQVAGTWGGEPVEVRVDCGRNEDGEPRAAGAPVTLSVRLVARERPVRQVGSPTGSEPGSRVRVSGQGRQPGDVRCSLTGEFRNRILRDVAELAGSPNPPPCEPAGIHCG